MKRLLIVFVAALGCDSPSLRPFPLQSPMWRDGDLASVSVRCRRGACAPRRRYEHLYWDGADNLIFRPLSEALGVVTSGEAANVNSLDEVPDSSWFQNRIGLGWMTPAAVQLGACKPADMLDPDHAARGSWVIDKGKNDGSTPGFRVVVPGQGAYLIKVEDKDDHPERQSAASAIGAAIHHAAGYHTTCEQVLYIHPALLTLSPGLVMRETYFSPDAPLDHAALDRMLARAPHHGELARVGASVWIKGYDIGPFRYEGTRDDDPNDVVAHEDRRELRALRLLDAWIDRFDARAANSLDAWMADDARRPRSSPGHVVHYQLDTSEALGGDWSVVGIGAESVSRRLGWSYVIDWRDMSLDFVSFGIPLRPWDTVKTVRGHELFGYFSAAPDAFDPERWKPEYPNIAFSRMTERDAAWMARILARFTPETIRAVAEPGRFTDPRNTAYLAGVLEARLERILERYLLGLSPLTEVHMEGSARLCAADLAEKRRLRDPARFHYAAHVVGGRGRALAVSRRANAEVCVDLVHDREKYVVVAVEDGVARGKLLVHLYDLGVDGFKLAGLERR
jgi:hypothetical protein